MLPAAAASEAGEQDVGAAGYDAQGDAEMRSCWSGGMHIALKCRGLGLLLGARQ